MRSPREIYVRQLHEELVQWAPEGKLEIRGRINLSRDKDKSEEAFAIATAKDARGSVLRLEPMLVPSVLVAKADKNKEDKPEKDRGRNDKDERSWRQWWTKIAVRSGYRAPEIDPEAFRTLLRLRDEGRSRFEFIFDTNALISGVGHWLVRMLGDRCDLVRTVVSDLEIQDKADNSGKSGQSSGAFKDFERRVAWLAASRFLERVPHDRPIWRRLDTGEETALFVATSSEGQSKSGGRDALLLRASRREILDQVPRLHRFFVTEDKNVARAALHDLPQGSVIATYANPLPSQVLHLSPHLWLPVGDNDQGSVVDSNLAEFLWEALCVCAELEVQRADGAVWRLRAYRPGANQYPSDWADPRLFIEEEATVGVHEHGAERPDAEISADAPAARSVAVAEGRMPREEGNVAKAEEAEARSVALAKTGDNAPEKDKAAGVGKGVPWWPLKKELMELLDPGLPVAPDVPGRVILSAFGEIVAAIDMKRAPDLRRVTKDRPLRNLYAFLRGGEFIDSAGAVAPRGAELPGIFEGNDLDALSRLCSAVEPYHRLISILREKGKLPVIEARALLRSADGLAALARLLGQAVREGEMLYDGGRWVSPTAFTRWLMPAFDQLAQASPLREAPVADLARGALRDLGLSPVRFGRALLAALALPELTSLEPTAGGEDRPILVESIAELAPGGHVRVLEISADGLHGIRSLKKRSR